MLGRDEAADFFDPSQRGLAGSFIALILAYVLAVVFMRMGNLTLGISPGSAAQLFFIVGLAALRFGVIWLVAPVLGATGQLSGYITASNWIAAIWITALIGTTLGLAIAGAFMGGRPALETISLILVLILAAATIALLVVEFNLHRILLGLGAGRTFLLWAAQGIGLWLGLSLLGGLLR